MKINKKATNFSLTPAIDDYVEKKLETLEKFFKDVSGVLVNVEVGKTSSHHKSGDIFKAEIHLMANGEEYYASAETEDLYASIDEVKDGIVRELTSRRKKAVRLLRKGGAKIKNMLRGAVEIKDKSWRRLMNFRNKN